MNKLGIVSLISILLLVVAISGCTTSDSNAIVLNQTFSNGGLTFKYPSTYIPATSSGELISGSQGVQVLGFYMDPNDKSNLTAIEVRKLAIPGDTVENLYAEQRSSFAQNSVNLMSDTRSSVNGITIYKFIYNLTDPQSSTIEKGYNLVFGKDGDVVYALDIVGPAESFEQINNIEKQMEPTIQIQ